MAVIEGAVTGNLQEVNSLFKGGRISVYPVDVLGWFSIGAKSGLTTTLAAGAPVFSFRNLGANPIMIRRIGIGFYATTAFTAAQQVDYGLYIARAFSASDTAGTAIAITSNNGKHRTSLASPTSLDVRIATAAANTAGTRTLDTDPIARIGAWIGAIGAGLNPGVDNLFSHNTGDYPLILAVNEGIVINNITLMGAAGVVQLFINIEFAEVTAY